MGRIEDKRPWIGPLHAELSIQSECRLLGGPLQPLQPSTATERGDASAAAPSRRALHRRAVPRQPPHGAPRLGPHADRAADAPGRHRGAVPEASAQPGGAGQEIHPYLTGCAIWRSGGQLGLGKRHHRCADAPGLSLPGGGDAPVQPLCIEWGIVGDPGHRLLPGGLGSRLCQEAQCAAADCTGAV